MSTIPKKVGLLGASLGTGNRGVSALGASVVKLVDEACPGAQTSLFIGERESKPFTLRVNGIERQVSVVNYRMSPKAPLNRQMWWILIMSLVYCCLPIAGLRRAIARATPWIQALLECSMVAEIRGGDSFSDIYGLQRFVIGSLPVLTVILVRGHVTLLPQTYGPYNGAAARALARFILRRSDTILSRDQEGMKQIEEMIGKTERRLFCPDVAFSLEAILPSAPRIIPPLPAERRECLIGLNVNGLMYNGGYTRSNMFGLKLDYPSFLAELASRLLSDPNNRLLLVPHTFAATGRVESDPDGCAAVLKGLPESMRSRAHLVDAPYDQNEIKGVIGLCDFFVGSRMHACIAALSQGIPAVGVAYSKKFRGVFESVGAGDWVVDGRDTDAMEGVNRVLELFAKRAELRAPLVDGVSAARRRHREIFQRLLK
jgi:colanic acid/amylovoran biosynthesis protein